MLAIFGLGVMLLAGGPAAEAADCNANGVEDAQDIARGASLDCNGNRNPDECDISPVNFGFEVVDVQQVGSTSAAAAVDLDGDAGIDVVAALDVARQLGVLLNSGGWNFPETVYFPISNRPVFLAARDLDGGGDADAAIAAVGSVSVAWNDGRGAFGEETVVPTNRIPVFLDTGDIDADGDIDLATANFDTERAVSIFASEGRTLAPPRDITVGQTASAVALEDFDLDGDLDVAVASPWSERINLLANDGRGELSGGPETQLRIVPIAMVAEDLDADGDPDLALASSGGSVTPLRNGGSGDFAATRAVETGVFYRNGEAYLAAGDLDGDRDIDIVLGHDLFLNDGGGAFALSERIAAPYWARTAAPADLDGDLDLDLAVAGGSTVTLLANAPVAWRPDCNSNQVPDDCEHDCNCNGVPDDCDLARPGAPDCNANRIPDDCETDCNRNRVPDDCDLATGTSIDCDLSGTLDECELAGRDCDKSGSLDDCDLRAGAADCNLNGIPDACDVEARFGLAGQERLDLKGGSVAVLDLDANGSLDIVAGGPGPIRAVLGDGCWRPGRVVEAARRGGPFAAGDLDADGDIDLCVAAPRSACAPLGTELRVLLAAGDGAFVARDAHAVGTTVHSLAMGDFDRDGITDVAAGAGGAVWLFRGAGRGVLTEPALAGDRGGALAAADLDGDGDLDLAAAEPDIDVGYVLVNDGAGSFARAATFITDGGELQAVDLDADAAIDLVTGGGWVHLNNGRGAFRSTPTRSSRFHERIADTVAAGDWDGDGDIDLAWLEGDLLAIYLNDAAGAFSLDARLNAPSLPGLAAADLDADGLSDLVVGGAVHVLFNLGQPGSFGRHVYLYPGASSVVHGTAAADLDGDGDRDLAVADGARLRLLVNDGQGRHALGATVGLAGWPLIPIDLDQDGDLDLAAGAGASHDVLTVRNDGGLLFTAWDRHPSGGTPRQLAAADWNGDGAADIAAAHDEATAASVLFAEGGGRLSAPLLLEAGVPQSFVDAWDHDGDRDLDLVAGSAGKAIVFANDGTGGLSAGPALDLEGMPTAGQIADFDGDGREDLAVALDEQTDCIIFGCRWVGKVLVVLPEVGGGFRRSVAGNGPGTSSSLAAADLDGDGDQDLAFPLGAWLEYDYFVSQDAVGLSWNDGAGRFASGGLFTVGAGPHTVIAADLDGSGTADLAVVASPSISVFLTQTASRSPDLDRNGVPDECTGDAFRRGDVNGDGFIDITDSIVILLHLFAGRGAPACRRAGDLDDDGVLALTDAIYGLGFLFRSGTPPAPPFPRCGFDATADGLDCASFPPCR